MSLRPDLHGVPRSGTCGRKDRRQEGCPWLSGRRTRGHESEERARGRSATVTPRLGTTGVRRELTEGKTRTSREPPVPTQSNRDTDTITGPRRHCFLLRTTDLCSLQLRSVTTLGLPTLLAGTLLSSHSRPGVDLGRPLPAKDRRRSGSPTTVRTRAPV